MQTQDAAALAKDTSGQRLQKFRQIARKTPVKIKSEKKLTQPVRLPLSSFSKDGYWEQRKKAREQRKRVWEARDE